jgi:hypothetical protein
VEVIFYAHKGILLSLWAYFYNYTSMKSALYCRVSTTEQNTENQMLCLVEYAKEKGLQYDVYEETIKTEIAL